MEEHMRAYMDEMVLQVFQTFEKLLIEYQIFGKLSLEKETKIK